MKIVGIIGGIAPESTVVYYREIVNSFLKLNNGNDYPQVIINSINMKKMLNYLTDNNLDELTKYLLAEIKRLANAKAEFALLASNTPHIVFDRLKKQSPIPLLSIVEATCKKAKSLGLKRVGLLGTKFTMQNNFYEEQFSKEEISIVTPDENSQNFIHNIYFNELVKGIFLDKTKQSLLKIIDEMIVKENIDGLILGGTELPIILNKNDSNIPLLDTTQIHVKEVIEKIIS